MKIERFLMWIIRSFCIFLIFFFLGVTVDVTTTKARPVDEEEESRDALMEEDDEMEEEESFGVYIKDIEFQLPFKPPPSQQFKDLKVRKVQLAEMVKQEKTRLESASGWLKGEIGAHLKWLENRLESVNADLARAYEEEGPRIPLEKLKEVTAEFIDRELTLEEMNTVAELVTLTYQEKGYILARAYVPEQEIGDGVLTIAISEGKIGDVKVSGQEYYSGRVIKRPFQEQIKHGVIREDLLEKGLILTKEIPDAETRVVLKRGEEPGTSDIQLNAEDDIGFSMSLDYNNFGSDLVGKDRFGTHITITDPWWGSTLKLRGVSGTDREKSALFSADYNVPVGGYGTKLAVSYLDGLYGVGKDLADLGLEGGTEIMGARIIQPIWRERNRSLTFNLGYDRKETENTAMETVRSIDIVDSYYASLDFDNLDRWLGKNLISAGLYYGSVNPALEAGPSRSGYSKNYNKLSVNAARIQKIRGYTNLMVRGTGQLSYDRLLPVEQMILGGYGTVRGHETSLFLGDSGYTLSAELLAAPPFVADKQLFGQRLGQMIQLALFVDHGGVYIQDPEEGEVQSNYLTGYGAGFRFYYKDLFQFKFDFALPTEDVSGDEEEIFYYFFMTVNLSN